MIGFQFYSINQRYSDSYATFLCFEKMRKKGQMTVFKKDDENKTTQITKSVTFQIRAAVPIRKGEHISIMYSDPMWGTANRQHHLYETKFFRCRCPRCLDPSELHTEFSSLKCPSCSIDRHGYLVPKEPLEHASQWECSGCKKTEPSTYVNAVIRSIGEELTRLERGNPEACQSFVKKHSQNLHPNHYYLMDVKLALSQMIGGQAGGGELHDLHEKDIVQKQKLCMEILNVANKISPGMRKQFSFTSILRANIINLLGTDSSLGGITMIMRLFLAYLN